MSTRISYWNKKSESIFPFTTGEGSQELKAIVRDLSKKDSEKPSTYRYTLHAKEFIFNISKGGETRNLRSKPYIESIYI